jgi:hypothetical protein
MGTTRKPPVRIIKADIETEVTPGLAGLPPMKTFIESRFYHRAGDGTMLKQLHRFFLREPTDEEKADMIALQDRGKAEGFDVVLCNININADKFIRKYKPLADSVSDLGFDSYFAENVARIFVSQWGNGSTSSDRLQEYKISILSFLTFIKQEFFKNKKDSILDFTLNDLSKEHFEKFIGSLDMSSNSRYCGVKAFNNTKLVLLDHTPSGIKNWLDAMKPGIAKRKKPSAEHTSPLFQEEDLYSDAVLYQMLGCFLTHFECICDRFDYFSSLTLADMPEDWWDLRINIRPTGASRGAIPHEYEKWQYIEKLLKDERYEDILKHELIFLKLGCNARKRFFALEKTSQNKIKDYETNLSKYYDFLKNTHNIDVVFHQSYLSGFDSSISPTFHRRMFWCLANVLMIHSGLNLEVVLSIPSLTDAGSSVLENSDMIFLSRDQSSEVQLYGYKERIGAKGSVKYTEAPIQKGGMLHTYLKRYEKHKNSSDGPFFDHQSGQSGQWGTAFLGSAGKESFRRLYPIINDDGTPLLSIATTKFRKIYGNAKLLELADGAESPQELAEKIPSILQQEGLNTFLYHYIFNTNRGAVAIDATIVGVTNAKLEESLNFKGKIEASNEEQEKKKDDNRIKVFLCDCENPFNPSHNEVIHERCRHYDLCLGCERSIVCLEHLPFICVRIIQYEEFRERNIKLWSEFYEDQYMIAHDTLNKYAKRSGVECVEAAWIEARSGKIKLPPLLKGFF